MSYIFYFVWIALYFLEGISDIHDVYQIQKFFKLLFDSYFNRDIRFRMKFQKSSFHTSYTAVNTEYNKREYIFCIFEYILFVLCTYLTIFSNKYLMLFL